MASRACFYQRGDPARIIRVRKYIACGIKMKSRA
jgi:hypothetical protein